MLKRILSEANAARRSFLRRRTAVFFTFFFPVLLVVTFAGLHGSAPEGLGLSGRPSGFYLPGFLGVIVVLTPLSRVGSTVARFRNSQRFEKLATTPLRRAEWLAAHTLVNVVVIGLASVLLIGVYRLLMPESFALSLWLIPLIVLCVTTFCGIGALLGHVADSPDGVVAASNALAFPLVFGSDTFVSSDQLPDLVQALIPLSPLTHFARGVRAATYASHPIATPLAVLALFALALYPIGAWSLRWTA